MDPDKFVPRQVWVAEDVEPNFLYWYQQDGHNLYMVEEPKDNMALIIPDLSGAPDTGRLVSMDYIRQEVRIRKDCAPVLRHEIRDHLKNGGRLYSMGSAEKGSLFVVSDIENMTSKTPAQYISTDDIEFVDVHMSGHKMTIKGDADDNFNEITVQAGNSNNYRYIYNIPRDGFPDLSPVSDLVQASEGPYTAQIQSMLSELDPVCNIQATVSGDNALITFESGDLLNIHEVSDRLEVLRLTNIHMGIGDDEQDFADAVASIPEDVSQMEQ